MPTIAAVIVGDLATRNVRSAAGAVNSTTTTIIKDKEVEYTMNVYCPKCGQPMRKSATEVKSNGKRVVIYVCPNRWGCGTIVQKEE